MVVILRKELVGRSKAKTALLEHVAQANSLNRTGDLDYNTGCVKDGLGLISVSDKFIDNFILRVLVPDYNIERKKNVFVGSLNKSVRDLLDVRGLQKCKVKAICCSKVTEEPAEKMIAVMPYVNPKKQIEHYYYQEFKVACPDIEFDLVMTFIRSKEYNNIGMFLKDFDVTMDFAGSFNKEEIIRYLVKNKGFREQGTVEEAPRTILNNDHLVGKNCLTYMECIDGVVTRQKIYNKMVQMLESQSVRSTVGCHLRDWVTQHDTRLATARDAATDRGLTRAEVTFYVEDGYIPPESFVEETLYRIVEYLPTSLIYATPYSKLWAVYCDCFNHSLVCVDQNTDTAVIVYSYNNITGKISGQLIETWSEKWEWAISKLTLNGNLPVDVIDIQSLPLSIVDELAKTDRLLEITGSRYFKINPDQSTTFSTRLVSRKGCYSYHSGTKEENIVLLQKAGLKEHKNCIPHLANTTANKNSKVDTKLHRVDLIEVTVNSRTISNKHSIQDNEDFLMDEVKKIDLIRKPLLSELKLNEKKLKVLRGYIKSLSTNNSTHLRALSQAEYTVWAAKRYASQFGKGFQYRLLVDVVGERTVVYGNWVISNTLDTLPSDVKEHVIDKESGYLTMFEKPLAYLTIHGQGSNMYGNVTVYCDLRMNQTDDESSVDKLKTDTIFKIDKCQKDLTATTSNICSEIEIIPRENLLRFGDYENLRCMAVGSVHRITALGYIEHYGRDRLVVKLENNNFYQAGYDLESKVAEIKDGSFVKIEKIKLNHNTRIKFAVCSVYNDWTALVNYNKTPFLKSFNGNTCVIDVKDTLIKGQKRKLILTDDGNVFRLKKSKLEEEIQPGYY